MSSNNDVLKAGAGAIIEHSTLVCQGSGEGVGVMGSTQASPSITADATPTLTAIHNTIVPVTGAGLNTGIVNTAGTPNNVVDADIPLTI
jgi:hypothetical protein